MYAFHETNKFLLQVEVLYVGKWKFEHNQNVHKTKFYIKSREKKFKLINSRQLLSNLQEIHKF